MKIPFRFLLHLDVGVKLKGKETRMEIYNQKGVLYSYPTKLSSGDCNFTVTRPQNIVLVNGVEVEVEVVEDNGEDIDGVHGPLSKRRGSEKKAYLGEMKAWLGSIVDICTSMCAYNVLFW